VALEGPGTTGPDGPALLTSGAARQKLPQAPSGLFFCPAGGMNKHDTPRPPFSDRAAPPPRRAGPWWPGMSLGVGRI